MAGRMSVKTNLNQNRNMQIANGIVVLTPENQQPVRGVTPPEVLILHRLHFKESNGSPLKDFVIQPGEAVMVEVPERAAEEEYFNQNSGKMVAARPAVPAKTHPRTPGEEAQRLKRKYSGVIEGKTAFEATFGSASVINLPKTFADIEDIVGITFSKSTDEAAEPSHADNRWEELISKSRTELVEIAIGLKLKTDPADGKETIVDAIITAETKKPAAKGKGKPEASESQ
jgi:hypothetical protein